MTTKNKFLSILSDIEQEALYGLPDFDDTQWLEFLAPDESELTLVSSRQEFHAQIYCILQIAYFKVKHLFSASTGVMLRTTAILFWAITFTGSYSRINRFLSTNDILSGKNLAVKYPEVIRYSEPYFLTGLLKPVKYSDFYVPILSVIVITLGACANFQDSPFLRINVIA